MRTVEEILKRRRSGAIKAKRESHRKRIIDNKTKCEVCNTEPKEKDKLWRFRINKNLPFSDSNSVVLCTKCHSELRTRLAENENYNQVITEMKLEYRINGS